MLIQKAKSANYKNLQFTEILKIASFYIKIIYKKNF